MWITVLSRGGLAVYGGVYDPHLDAAVVTARDGETVPLIIDYPEAPSAPTKTESGISSTTPTVSGTKLTATLSAIQEEGYVDITATTGGAQRTVRIKGRSRSEVERYETD
jgi:hypothetical protein